MVRPLIQIALLALFVVAGATPLFGQRAAQVMNYNAHEGKYETGGFGVGLMLGSMLSGDMFRAELITDVGGGGRLGDGAAISRTETVAGLSLAYQMGTDSDTVGTDLSLDFISHNVELTEAGTFGTISSVATVAFLGFDWVINFYKSEYIERDGRRTRDGFNFSLLIGPKLGFFFGDFSDLNGMSLLGIDLGLALDIPLKDDVIQLNPAMWFEMNYHFSDQVDVGTHDSTDTGLAAGQGRSLDGVLVRTHNFVPPSVLNIGSDLVFTPLFVGERGNLVNAWRFNLGLYLTLPLAFNAFAADLPGDPLYTDKVRPTYVAFSFGASYFW